MVDIHEAIKRYRKDVLAVHKHTPKLNESGTRLLVNDFLKQVLGFTPNEEIKTEYEIAGGYADYVLQTGRKKRLVVEVKALATKLNTNHLRQSLGYAASEGIDWIFLLNGHQFQLYKVMFQKPVSTKLVFNVDIFVDEDYKGCDELFALITRKALAKDSLDDYWKKVDSLSTQSLPKYLFDESVLRLLRRNLRSKTSVNFACEDIADALHTLVTTAVDMPMPRVKVHAKGTKKSVSHANTMTAPESAAPQGRAA